MANGRPVRADVVEAAIAVFREKGYERATVREIAYRAGLGTSTLYFHVKSKEELYLAAVAGDLCASNLAPVHFAVVVTDSHRTAGNDLMLAGL